MAKVFSVLRAAVCKQGRRLGHAGGRSTTRAQRGAAAVEFALVLPLLLAVLLGAVEMGLVLYDKAVLTVATREGARAGIVLRNPKLTAAEITAIVQQRVQANLITLMPSTPAQITVLQSTPAAYPNTLQVSVQYTFRGLALGALMQSLGNPWVIHASTVMVHE